MNISYLSEKKEDLFLYKFRDIVLETEDPTLLNINCLDAGLYTVCDIVPTCRWFQTQTILLDYVMEEQEGYFHLLSKRNRLLAKMVCRTPGLFGLTYRLYEKLFRREEEH